MHKCDCIFVTWDQECGGKEQAIKNDNNCGHDYFRHQKVNLRSLPFYPSRIERNEIAKNVDKMESEREGNEREKCQGDEIVKMQGKWRASEREMRGRMWRKCGKREREMREKAGACGRECRWGCL